MGMRRRAKVMLACLFILFFGLIVRLTLIAVDNQVQTVGVNQGSRALTVAQVRGTIYDRNLTPLVNASNTYYATMLPEERLLQCIDSVIDQTEYNHIFGALDSGTPLVARLNGPAAICDGIRVYLVPHRYGDNTLAAHLLGYLDGSGCDGVCGIEKAYDNVLDQFSGRITATYSVDGQGRYVANDGIQVLNTAKNYAGGVVTTLDGKIQKTVEDVASVMINKGTVIVMEPNTGDVLSLASFPSYDPANISNQLSEIEGSLVNRALARYDCGSVFKIVTALAALENGVSSDQVYDCPGSITVDGTVFHCHYRLGHQQLTMEEAFAQSCNVYFIQLASQIGADALLEMAKTLGLNDTIELAQTISSPAAVMPNHSDLSSASALANLSFGQGKLLISPLHIARMTAVIASNGTLPEVSVVLGTVDENGNWLSSTDRGGETVISSQSVQALRRMMTLAVSNGTGTAASADIGVSAGKTGTAETGQVNNNRAVVHSWFTGYYPADDPRYVITIFIEDKESNDASAAQVFGSVVNSLDCEEINK